MARRTTVVLTPEDAIALQRASRAEGLSQSQLIRKGIRAVTAPYRRKARPLVGWLKLSRREREELARDEPGDYDR
ncbi:MAG: hypothetical protein AB1938_17085 [Myxococcota bacterium]